MNILLIEPGKKPKPVSIENSLESMQSIVGGLIQAVFPFPEPVALICNDEAKLLGLPFNRVLRNEDGTIYDAICGTFFLCGAPDDSDDFTGLPQEQQVQFTRYFERPECMFRTENGLIFVRM